MTKLEEVVDKISNDLFLFKGTREEYLAICAKKRIDDLNRKYDEDFNKLFKLLDEENLNNIDLRTLSTSIKNYSDTINELYHDLIRDINHYKNNFT